MLTMRITQCDCIIKDHLEKEFEIVSSQAKEIDPEQNQDWFSLTLGWALAKGLTPAEAHTFSAHIRYHTDLG
jgi:hypothetical protein